MLSELSTPMTQADAEFSEALKPAIATAPMNRMGTAQEGRLRLTFSPSSIFRNVCGSFFLRRDQAKLVLSPSMPGP